MTAPATFGTYLVYEEIGKGGMATVHRAIDGENREVALKRLLTRAAQRQQIVRSFLHEAHVLHYLHHQNIMETYDFGKVGDTYFISMEYIAGKTLKQIVYQCAMTIGAVPYEIILNLAFQLCDALDYAHNLVDDNGNPLHIIHRDVCPSNIILAESGLLKLIDFGLAKAKTTSIDTDEGFIKGKFAYVAPEYLDGELDPRADLWAVGVVMYELLTSRRLFNAPDDFETMNRVRKLPIPRPSIANTRVTPELDDIVMRALARDPARRWQDAASLREALRRIIQQPDNYVDNKHVIDWVNWVFTQKPGTEASGVSKLRKISGTTPPSIATEPVAQDLAPMSLRPRTSNFIWIMLVGAALLAGLVAWKLAV